MSHICYTLDMFEKGLNLIYEIDSRSIHYPTVAGKSSKKITLPVCSISFATLLRVMALFCL